jgi:hypothetical protein
VASSSTSMSVSSSSAGVRSDELSSEKMLLRCSLGPARDLDEDELGRDCTGRTLSLILGRGEVTEVGEWID